MVLRSGRLYANGCYSSIISFGDSLADTGNLKELALMFGQVFPYFSPPYDETFFHEPTGRCSDGCLIIDFLGCSSSYLTIFGSHDEEYDPTTGCFTRLNKFAEYHNELLQIRLDEIRELHPNVIIIYANYYNAAMQIFRSPDKFGTLHVTNSINKGSLLISCSYESGIYILLGFTNGVLKVCCGGGGPFNYNMSARCGYTSATVCDEPNTYANWDGVHLTEAAYQLIFKSLFQGPCTTPQFSSLCQ
ncbi:Lipase, GDSL [Artemisia annua]|uniref:Lipase, GDSL n=1 Tax=Artemisia annua TaxID=35608 RepID=A0A2U1PK56_ARTAN|nr:Lipase, GDSL [Artemisia annua]